MFHPSPWLLMAALLCLAAGGGANVRADLVTGTFAGSVTTINPTSVPAPVQVGETFLASFRFQSDTVDVDAGSATSGKYFGALLDLSFVFSGGFQAATSLPVAGHVMVDAQANSVRLIYPFAIDAPTSHPSYSVDALDVWLYTSQDLTTDALPTMFGNELGGTGTLYSYYDGGGTGPSGVFDFSVQVAPTSLSVSAVPEPAGWRCLLIASGLCLTGCMLRTGWKNRRGDGQDRSSWMASPLTNHG